jgi:hypothetical protein
MTLFGISKLSTSGQEIYASTLEKFTISYYDEEGEREVIEATVSVIKVFLSLSQRRVRDRHLQTSEDSVTVQYDQEFLYRKKEFLTTTGQGLATVPFSTQDQQDKFVEALKNSGSPELEGVTKVSEVSVGATLNPTPTPETDAPTQAPKDEGLPVPALIGIGLGGAGFCILCCVFYLYCASGQGDEGRYTVTNPGDEPPENVKVANYKSDDVSQLPEPQGRMEAPTSHESLGGYGDQRYEQDTHSKACSRFYFNCVTNLT